MLSINGTRESNKKDISITPPIDLFEREIFVNCGTSMIDRLQNNALRESLNRFLNRLSPREHRIFLRRYFYAESVKAIADRYDLRESNVLSILSRTRKKLKEHLQKEGFEL